MKNILMGSPERLKTVYPQDIRNKIGVGVPVSKEDVLSSTGDYSNTEFIFSTWGMPSFTAEEIAEYFPSLRAVFYAAGSVQGFARPFLEAGVMVFSAWEANDIPVAEFTVAEIVLAAKGFFGAERVYRGTRSKRNAGKFSASHRGNYRSSVGIIGCGMVGSMVAERLREYGTKVYAYDPYMSEEKASRLGVESVSLAELFATCDTVTNHVPNNPSTVGMLGGELFASMKPYSVFINTGRGKQIKEDEFIDVLRERRDITALLDVTYPEPPDENSPLFELPNVWLTPHIAGSMNGECVRMAESMCEEYNHMINGLPVRHSVTLEMLVTMA